MSECVSGQQRAAVVGRRDGGGPAVGPRWDPEARHRVCGETFFNHKRRHALTKSRSRLIESPRR